MRQAMKLLGLLMLLEGISGALDHVAVQPFFGIVLNAFNRLVVERVSAFEGVEVFANLSLAALGAAVMIAAARVRPS
ncbi:hypothetical protein AB0L05_28595 [Nonomuraea pusilla]|uniref:hypothetical protein n=1 Tax=Nonomuraea pusilla TaxID=46177 RepID=UPI003329C15D